MSAATAWQEAYETLMRLREALLAGVRELERLDQLLTQAIAEFDKAVDDAR